MTEEIFDKIMNYYMKDCSISMFDLENNKIVGEYSVNGNEIKSFKDKLRFYLIDKYRKEGFDVFIPLYKGENFSLYAKKGDRKILLHLVLDSEEERVAWRLSELPDDYEKYIVRDSNECEVEGLNALELDRII